MIDAALGEIIVGGLRLGEQILGHASPQIPAIGPRKQRIEERLDGRIHGDLTGGQQARSTSSSAIRGLAQRSRNCIRQQFTTIRVIHVLKLDSPRNLWKCRKPAQYAVCTASSESSFERRIPYAVRRDALNGSYKIDYISLFAL
jgi:hypothetical protein